MSMFNRDNKENMTGGSDGIETVIGPSVKVEGNFAGSGDVSVEGAVVGGLKTAKNLRIGESARIKADVEAENIHVSGEVRGNIKCKGKLELTATGKVIGNVETQSLMVESGAILNGKCQMLSQEEKGNEVIELPEEEMMTEKKGKNNRK
ncbi:MAG: polymer-forming cytoskeletal protein [Patescibacteria group bacterium]